MRQFDLSRVVQTEVEDWVQLLPNLVKLLGRLIRDPRVPRKHKAVLVGVTAYVISPFDVIPGFIPGIGQLDDLALIAFALRAMLLEIDDNVVLAHWDGNRDLLELVQVIVERSTQWVPPEVLSWLQTKSAPHQSDIIDGEARQ